MNSPQSMNLQQCVSCGNEIPGDSPGGLCPTCLIGNVLKGNPSELDRAPFAATSPGPRGPMPPEAEEIAVLFPQFELDCLLGHGGMGAVYRARQKKLDRTVALKIIRPESATDPAFAERFMREARTLARLNHPHIVAIHDFGEVHDAEQGRTLYYFAMEYVDGANLRQLMGDGRLNPDLALSIVSQICDALQYAHDEGIIHRDIKPENILIDARGRVKIADFGLAKLAVQSGDHFTLTATHQIMGTLRYMAPEQMEGARSIDHRADIYSLGVVFYEMLTGQIPAGHFEPPSRRAGSDRRLDEIVLRAMAYDPNHRFQSVSELRSGVEQITSSGSQTPAHRLMNEQAAATGFSTILDREAMAIWRFVGGTPAASNDSPQSRLPVAVLLLLSLCGALMVLLPWVEVTFREPNAKRTALVVPEAMPLVANAAGTSDDSDFVLCQSLRPSVAERTGQTITVETGTGLVLYGTARWPGITAACLFGALAFVVLVVPRASQLQLHVTGTLTLLAALALLHTLLFPGEIETLGIRLASADRSQLLASDHDDAYTLCLWQDPGLPPFGGMDGESLALHPHDVRLLSGYYGSLVCSLLLIVVGGLGIRHSLELGATSGPGAALGATRDIGRTPTAGSSGSAVLGIRSAVENDRIHASESGHHVHLAQVAGPVEFSRKAIVGAILVPIGLLIFAGVMVPTVSLQSSTNGPPADSPLIRIVLFVGLGAIIVPIVATTLGALALSDIRAAHGRLRGTGLAFFDVAFFPTLVASGVLIAILITGALELNPRLSEGEVRVTILAVVLLTAVLNFFVLRMLWFRVSRSGQNAVSSKAEELPLRRTDSGVIDPVQRRLRQELRSASMCLILAAVLGLIFWIAMFISFLVDRHSYVDLDAPDVLLPFLGVGGSAIGIAWFMIWAGRQLKAVRRHEICFAASILAIIPWAGAAWLVSFPVGLWIFHLLKRESVRDLFLMHENDE